MRSVILRVSAASAALIAGSVFLGAAPALASSAIVGDGSSFAGNEFQEWAKDVNAPPYNLNVTWTSSSSGQGRSDFRDKTVDFAVTDIRYDPPYDVNPPDESTFAYIPVTAGGVAFMYNLRAHGFTTANPIKLSSLAVCGIFTGSIPYWDDPHIAGDNPGVQLPHVPVRPVVRNDPAGTNFVLMEYCIALHNDLYAAFAQDASRKTQTDYPDAPTSNWPIVPPIIGATGSNNAADTVADQNSDGEITEVETSYALQRHYPVASVQNDTGAYVQPTDIAVATALSYAQQLQDGTHKLNFTPGDAGAYNPSTYSYMLVRLGSGASAGVGASVTAFANYCLTIGQSKADSLGYASIGRNLIEFGLNRLQAVPGYVPPTQAELNAVPAQQQVAQKTTSEAPGGNSTVSAGATGGGSSTSGGSGSSGSTASTGSNSSAGSSAPGSGASGSGSSAYTGNSSSAAGSSASTGSTGATGSTASSALGAADPSVSLPGTTGALGQTGIESDIPLALGGALLLGGEAWRRRARRARA